MFSDVLLRGGTYEKGKRWKVVGCYVMAPVINSCWKNQELSVLESGPVFKRRVVAWKREEIIVLLGVYIYICLLLMCFEISVRKCIQNLLSLNGCHTDKAWSLFRSFCDPSVVILTQYFLSNGGSRLDLYVNLEVEKDFEETSARPDTKAETKWWTGP